MRIPGWLRRGRRTRFVALTGLIAVLPLAFSVMPASAAPAPAARPAIVHMTPGSTPGRFTLTIPRPHRIGAPAAQDLPPTITCSGQIGGPAVVGLSVRVAATLSCSFVVEDLELTMTLFRNGLTWGSDFTSTIQFAAVVASGPCLSGGATFSGNLHVFIDAGPEYSPPSITDDVSTGNVVIAAC